MGSRGGLSHYAVRIRSTVPVLDSFEFVLTLAVSCVYDVLMVFCDPGYVQMPCKRARISAPFNCDANKIAPVGQSTIRH